MPAPQATAYELVAPPVTVPVTERPPARKTAPLVGARMVIAVFGTLVVWAAFCALMRPSPMKATLALPTMGSTERYRMAVTLSAVQAGLFDSTSAATPAT